MTFAGSEIDASGLHEVIEGALHEAEESRAERARKHADWLAQHSARLELFRQALLPLVDVSGTPIFSDVRLIPSYPPNPATDPPEPKIFGEWANPECAANSDPQFTGDIWSGLGHQYDFGGVRDEPGFSFLTSEDPIHLALVVEGAFRSSEDRRRARKPGKHTWRSRPAWLVSYRTLFRVTHGRASEIGSPAAPVEKSGIDLKARNPCQV